MVSRFDEPLIGGGSISLVVPLHEAHFLVP